MKDVVTKFNESNYFFFSLITISAVCWLFNWSYFYLSILLVIFIINVLFYGKVRSYFPIFYMGFLGFKELEVNIPILLIISMLFLFFLFVDLLYNNRTFRKKGIQSKYIYLFIIISILTVFNTIDFMFWLYGLIYFVLILLFYLYIYNNLDDTEDNFDYAVKTIIYSSFLISVLSFLFIVQSEDILYDIIVKRTLKLSWQNINNLTFPIVYALPLIGYKIVKSDYKIWYMLMFFIQVLTVFVTYSRAALGSCLLYILALIPLIYKAEENRKKLRKHTLYFLGVLLVFVLINHNYIFDKVISLLFNRHWSNNNGRFYLLELAFEYFKHNPIFGYGGYFTSIKPVGLPYCFYANDLAQMTTYGIVGVVTFIYMFYTFIMIIFKPKKSYSGFVFLMIMISFLFNGMFQPMFLMTLPIVLFLMIFIEKDNKKLVAEIK